MAGAATSQRTAAVPAKAPCAARLSLSHIHTLRIAYKYFELNQNPCEISSGTVFMTSSRWSSRVSLAQHFEGYVTKSAPHKAQNLIA